jgi:AcrR family transcriptional regulator
MSKAISAREAQSLRIREALLNACGDLLSEQPIDAITINNIVETAGVAKGSFYNHFPDKEALAAEVSSAIRVELERSVEESNRNVTDPAYRLVRGMCIHLQMAVADPRRAIIMLRGAGWRTATNNPLNEGIKADIADGLASGRFEPRCEDAGVIQVIGAGDRTGHQGIHPHTLRLWPAGRRSGENRRRLGQGPDHRLTNSPARVICN